MKNMECNITITGLTPLPKCIYSTAAAPLFWTIINVLPGHEKLVEHAQTKESI